MSALVSVIVTTKNEAAVIGTLLKSIQQQSYPHNEIIVVDNKSTDDTSQIAKKFTSNVYTYGPERSSQRNFGAKKAKGEYFFFLDADMELTKDVVKECVALCKKKPKIGAITIPEESIANSFWEKVKAFERSFYNDEGDSMTDAARFFPRDCFTGIGGYDEQITGPEDWDITERVQKAGFSIMHSQELIYHYERIPSPLQLAKKKYYYALRAHRYLQKHNISTFSPKTIYFLRPVFYRKWKRLVSHPTLTLGMIGMLTMEMSAGALGYAQGKMKHL